MRAAMDDDDGDVLTKAKLYATMSDDDSWTEMGVGVVSVVLRPATPGTTIDGIDDDSGSCSSDGQVERTVGQLEMIDIENPAELLMSTPITLSDAYVVQQDTILWWSDPQLGRLMACSFNTKEGCEKIHKEILAYQRSRKNATSREMNGAERPNVASVCSQWIVCRENLPAILSAALTNAQRFGVYVRGRDTYFKELAELFQACQRDGDLRGMDLTGQITLALLRSPFSTDGKIIAQFVENSLVDTCVDIVQYAIGRRDRQTGFVSFEERRATFRNPLHLPESTVARIHVLYSCSYLKDLLPLSLDEADAVPSSLLSTYLMSSKFRLVEEICKSPAILPQAFKSAYTNVANAFDIVAFVHDTCKTLKNSMMPLECKSSMFEALIEASLLPFLRFVLLSALQIYEAPPQQQQQPPPPSSTAVMPGMAMQMACDILCSCIMLYPAGRSGLITEASSNPDGCLLELLLRCIVTSRCGAELQAAFDAVVSCGIGILQYLPGNMETGGATKHDVVRFWVEGNAAGRRPPPLLLLAAHLARVLGDIERIPCGSHEEGRVLHALKVLTALVGELDEPLSRAFSDLLHHAGVLSCFNAALHATARRATNMQSSIVALIASLLDSGKRCFAQLLLQHDNGALFDTAIRRHMACGPHSNVLSSSLAHLFDSLCRAIHREKSGKVRHLPPVTCSPFVHLLHGAEEDSLGGRTGTEAGDDAGDVDQQGVCNSPCQALGGRLWSSFGEELRSRCPALASRLERALQETPEEALSVDAETSSVASTLERSIKGISDIEFDAMVVDFGVELHSPRGSVTSSLHTAHTTALYSGDRNGGVVADTDEDDEDGDGDGDGDEDYDDGGGRGELQPLLKRTRFESSSSSSFSSSASSRM